MGKDKFPKTVVCSVCNKTLGQAATFEKAAELQQNHSCSK